MTPSTDAVRVQKAVEISTLPSPQALEEQRVSFMIRELITLADKTRQAHAEILGTSILAAYRRALSGGTPAQKEEA